MDAKLLGSSNIIGDIMIDAYNGVWVPVPLERSNIRSIIANSDEGILLVDVNWVHDALGVNNSTTDHCAIAIPWVAWVALDRSPITLLKPPRPQRFEAKRGLRKRIKNSVLFCRCLFAILHEPVDVVNRRKVRSYFESLFGKMKMSKFSMRLPTIPVNRRVCRKAKWSN